MCVCVRVRLCACVVCLCVRDRARLRKLVTDLYTWTFHWLTELTAWVRHVALPKNRRARGLEYRFVYNSTKGSVSELCFAECNR